MFKKVLAITAMMLTMSSFAAVDVNKSNAADLDGIKGVGPGMSKRIVDARAQGEFKDWGDFMSRVKGVKAKTATKLSGQGLTVNGKSFDDTAVADRMAKGEAKSHPMSKTK
ncbi:MAG: helix-hairpin-helix domain-containing protein [Variovorax sp.]|jgi:competence protein ComEA|nr:MAG: helix-hairpin-helix domain-containing protein [Variovorax sp.]